MVDYSDYAVAGLTTVEAIGTARAIQKAGTVIGIE